MYSEPDPKNSDEYINIVLTCQHVVDGSIKMRDEFDSVLKRNRKTDYFEGEYVDHIFMGCFKEEFVIKNQKEKK